MLGSPHWTRSLPRAAAATALALAATLAASAAVAAPAGAHGRPGSPGAPATPPDQPLPGFTIDNPPLPPLLVGGRPSTVLQGVHEHAAYDIEVPPRWNGELVMWAHGFRGQGTVLTVDPPGFGLRQKLLDQGYAWAASSYARNGYDVATGVTSTHDLAVLFGRLVGPARRTYVTGVSMGGHVTGRSVEQYPRFYDGALPMCGVLGDVGLFDFFLDYTLVAQGLSGIRAFPPPPDYLTAVVPRIQATLGIAGLQPGGPGPTTAAGRQFQAITVNRSGGPRPGSAAAFAFWKDFLFAISVSAGVGDDLAADPGQVATNVGTRYLPDSPVAINRVVQRVPAENPVARRSPRLSPVATIAGRPNVPVLSLHGLGDLFVPFGMEQAYARDVAAHHRGRLVVQRAIRTVGHCEFSPAEAGAAWDDLVRWVRAGHRPAGDPVTDARAVAAPDFGCRFSDPAAFATPPAGSTRRLFAACPAPDQHQDRHQAGRHARAGGTGVGPDRTVGAA